MFQLTLVGEVSALHCRTEVTQRCPTVEPLGLHGAGHVLGLVFGVDARADDRPVPAPLTYADRDRVAAGGGICEIHGGSLIEVVI